MRVIDDVRDAASARHIQAARLVKDLVEALGDLPREDRTVVARTLAQAAEQLAKAYPAETEGMIELLRPLHLQITKAEKARQVMTLTRPAEKAPRPAAEARAFRKRLVEYFVYRRDDVVDELDDDDRQAVDAIRDLYDRGAWGVYNLTEDDRRWWTEAGCSRPEVANRFRHAREQLQQRVSREEYLRLQLEDLSVSAEMIDEPLTRALGERWLTPEAVEKLLAARASQTTY